VADLGSGRVLNRITYNATSHHITSHYIISHHVGTLRWLCCVLIRRHAVHGRADDGGAGGGPGVRTRAQADRGAGQHG
jgi:hypothetical protein